MLPPCSVYVDYILKQKHPYGKEFVAYLLEQHDAGLSWNGEWNESDVSVVNGKPSIVKLATVGADNDCKYENLKNLTLQLFPDYVIEKPAPVYLDIIQKEFVSKMDFYDKDQPRFKTFLRWLSNNPAWKSPLVLSSLTQNIHKVCNSLRKIGNDGKRDPPDKLQTDILNGEWQRTAEYLWGFDGVYKFDNAHGNKYPYTDFFCFLEYVRHSGHTFARLHKGFPAHGVFMRILNVVENTVFPVFSQQAMKLLRLALFVRSLQLMKLAILVMKVALLVVEKDDNAASRDRHQAECWLLHHGLQKNLQGAPVLVEVYYDVHFRNIFDQYLEY